MLGAIPSLSQYVFKVWCIIKSAGTNLTLPCRRSSELWRHVDSGRYQRIGQVCFSETLVSTHKSTRRHNPEEQHQHHRRENLRCNFSEPYLPWPSSDSFFLASRSSLNFLSFSVISWSVSCFFPLLFHVFFIFLSCLFHVFFPSLFILFLLQLFIFLLALFILPPPPPPSNHQINEILWRNNRVLAAVLFFKESKNWSLKGSDDGA
jgi:hypothetical protein